MSEPDKKSIAPLSIPAENDLQAASESFCNLMNVKSSVSLSSISTCSRQSTGKKCDMVNLSSSWISSESVPIENCLICEHLQLEQMELKRNHRILLQKLENHKKLSHSVYAADLECSPRIKLDICMNKSSSSSRATSLGRSVDGHGDNGQLFSPRDPSDRNVLNPPKPRVRRLIGEEAKLIGNKIDSSNLNFILSK